MSSYAAFLRGINLGSRNKISSAELREIFEGMGFEDVAPFRTSGNVVFSGARSSPAKLGARIGKEIEKVKGFEVITFVRTEAEVRAIAKHQPFPAKLVKASDGKLQVSLLAKQPSAAVQKEILALATDEDRLAFKKTELYWLPSGGMRDTALNLRAIDKQLHPMTRRTKGTIEELAKKFFDS
jgi:uncharacterized protein (DUF1697 family)